MNLSLIILVIAQLESSSGRSMCHPTACYGWVGAKQIALDDVNRHYDLHFTPQNMLDRGKAFEFARFYIEMYAKEDWTAVDVISFWRCGVKGMHEPTAKEQLYINRGMRMYRELVQGNIKWQETL